VLVVTAELCLVTTPTRHSDMMSHGRYGSYESNSTAYIWIVHFVLWQIYKQPLSNFVSLENSSSKTWSFDTAKFI
jgi:hypothetical protein